MNVKAAIMYDALINALLLIRGEDTTQEEYYTLPELEIICDHVEIPILEKLRVIKKIEAALAMADQE